MSVVALCGGVGGVKLALGLYRVLPPRSLTIVVNTGDDFTHMGLKICPDLDTVTYTLADLNNPEHGWGRRNETWTLMTVLGGLGGETWFKLGDGDTALHLWRTALLAASHSLTNVTQELMSRLRIHASVLPMTDSTVSTRLETDRGELAFQDYFVRQRCQPTVHSIRFAGASDAVLPSQVLEALSSQELEAIILCPSNPFLSIDPMLSIPGLRSTLERRRAPLLAVSPLIGSQAVKGPTAKIMRELGISLSPASIATHYEGMLDAIIIDSADTIEERALAISAIATNILMHTLEDKVALAKFTLNYARHF